MTDNITINTHSSIRIADKRVIYSDPFGIEGEPHDADIILITHPHYDHYSPDDIKKVMKDDTVIVCPETVKEPDALGLKVIRVKAGDIFEAADMSFTALPAYNIMKPFHPKSRGWLGYIAVTEENGRVYIAGDTDPNDDNRKVKCDVALVPIGGTYTMDAMKAAAFVNAIKPRTAIPTHYGNIIGNLSDADTFKKQVDKKINVVIKIR